MTRWAAAVAACLAVMVSAGCSTAGIAVPELGSVPDTIPGQCRHDGDGLVLAVSGHANAPGAALPEPVVRLLAAVARSAPLDGSGSTVTVIEVTAAPSDPPAVSTSFSSRAENDVAIDADRQSAFAEWYRAAHTVRALSGEIDVLGALATAARYTSSGTIVLVAPGLQTVAPLDFTTPPGLLGADPADVVAFLRSENRVPDLAERTVVLAGIGDTAAPQPPLGDLARRQLTELWSAVAQAGGACVEIVDHPRTGEPPVDVPPVAIVDVPAARGPVDGCGGVVLDQARVGFVRDSASFLSREDAARVVEPIAACLRADRSHRVLLTGTTACAGSEQGRLALSEQRAAALGALLVELGATPAQVTTRGVGSEFPEYIPDRGPGGLLPGPAAANRSVRVTRHEVPSVVDPTVRRCPL